MRLGSNIAAFSLVLGGVFITGACSKVPLRDDAGSISLGSMHWFENEKTGFIFFSIDEAPERLTDPIYEFSYVEQTQAGGTTSHPMTEIDMSSGVHEHAVVNCGARRVCGSYSFRADNPLVSGVFRFRYDRGSDQSLTIDLSPNNRPAGDTSDAYSALLYGVFDKTNSHVQVRVHHNFGAPSSDEVPSFGLTRRFQISEPVLFQPNDASVIAGHRAQVASPLLYPATFCAGMGATNASFAGHEQWRDLVLDPTLGQPGACFNSRYLDRNNAPLVAADQPGFAFRNPDVMDATLRFNTPLRKVNEIPIFVKICADEPSAGAMTDVQFLNYQKFILGMVDRDEDLCFRIGQVAQFRQSFERHIGERIAAAKVANSTGGDFMFIVLLHERFSPEFLTVQGAIAEVLTTAVKAEELYVSPRLVGAMVYSGSTNFMPTANQRKYITWCPQELLEGFFNPSTGSQNCVTTRPMDLDLTVINFVAPMGPLPSLDNYNRYVDEHGDTGLARNPDLAFYSPQLTVNSQVEVDTRVTFFDGQVFSLRAGEYAKVCSDRFDPEMLSFFVRTPNQPASVPSVPLYDMNATWLSDDAEGAYRVGISWEFPYWGGIEYTSALSGKVVAVVPYQRSFRTYEALGDPKWRAQSWDFGTYVQKCSRFCDNPVFDEAGVYHPASIWRQELSDRCQIPNPPSYPGAEGAI